MKRLSLITFAFAAPLTILAQTTVFSDNFSGSTIQSAAPGAGTASAADYEVFVQGSTAPVGYSIAPGALHFATPATGSALGEVMARFGGSPVTLANVGDYVNLSLTFVDTAGVLVAGGNANSSVNIGLFNSGGVNLNQGTFLGSGSSLSGGSQTYLGYVGRLFLNGNASGYNRNSQTATGTTSQNQDLLFNNASSSAAFNSPLGANFTGTSGSPTGFTTGLVSGDTYTFSYTITLTAANAVQVNNQLYTGPDTSGTQLMNFTGTSTSGAFLGASFDTLAFGFRYANAAATGGALDISKISVVTNVPEPSIMALSGLGLLALGAVRRWKR